jgi:hypothetical protein
MSNGVGSTLFVMDVERYGKLFRSQVNGFGTVSPGLKVLYIVSSSASAIKKRQST